MRIPGLSLEHFRLLPPRADIPRSHGDRVREVLLELVPNGAPTIEQVAKRLGQSARSLQRHLREESTSLTTILDDMRRDISQAALVRGASTTENRASARVLRGQCLPSRIQAMDWLDPRKVARVPQKPCPRFVLSYDRLCVA